MVARIFRALRKSLEDDGLIGRVMTGTIYRTISSIRQILHVLVPLLWRVESLFGKYTMSRMDRIMLETFHQPDIYGPLGQALESRTWQVLNGVLLAWLVFDAALTLLYYILEWFTLEEYEKAQREYDKMREQLGDVQVDNNANNNFLTSLVGSRPFRYITWGVFIVYAVGTLNYIGAVVSEEIASIQEYSNLDVTTANLAKMNPYRDLLPEQDSVLRELVYMSHVLRQLTPTTLPEDDYQLFSNMIRSLETRTDISWRVYEETDIRQRISAAANRGRNAQKPIAEEPFSIEKRVKLLHSHWQDLAIAPSKPDRWEDASDTTFMTPLIATISFGERGAKMVEDIGTAKALDEIEMTGGGFKLALTSEQEAEATRIYNKWRRTRDRKVSYLKDHPPTPLAWAPVAKFDTDVRNAWDTLFDDGRVEAGRRVPVSKLSGSKQWKPIFSSLSLESVPFDWVLPGEEPQTVEDSQAELEALYKESDRRDERRTKQEEYLAQLKASIEDREKKKEL